MFVRDTGNGREGLGETKLKSQALLPQAKTWAVLTRKEKVLN